MKLVLNFDSNKIEVPDDQQMQERDVKDFADGVTDRVNFSQGTNDVKRHFRANVWSQQSKLEQFKPKWSFGLYFSFAVRPTAPVFAGKQGSYISWKSEDGFGPQPASPMYKAAYTAIFSQPIENIRWEEAEEEKEKIFTNILFREQSGTEGRVQEQDQGNEE